MLTLEQIMELQEKGFTWDQIAAVNNTLGQATPEPEAKETQEPEAKETQEPEAKEMPEVNPTPVDATDTLEKKIDEMAATIQELQAANVKKAEMDVPKPLTADDIVKSFMEAS